MTSSEAEGGLIDSLRRLLSSIVEAVQTRFELAAVEIEEQVHWASELLVWTFVALAAAACGIVMLGLLVVVVFWEHRILASALVALTYLLTSVAALVVLRTKVRARPRLFDTSMGELAKDRQALDRR
jgi:uncharacterized membrane protein YqjE